MFQDAGLHRQQREPKTTAHKAIKHISPKCGQNPHNKQEPLSEWETPGSKHILKMEF